jgi:hypothetical protein
MHKLINFKDSKNSEIPSSIVNKWIGWKTIMYNIENNSAVKMESYLDIDANNNWIKVSEVEDKGGWYADTSDEIFYSANCGREKDYIIPYQSNSRC